MCNLTRSQQQMIAPPPGLHGRQTNMDPVIDKLSVSYRGWHAQGFPSSSLDGLYCILCITFPSQRHQVLYLVSYKQWFCMKHCLWMRPTCGALWATPRAAYAAMSHHIVSKCMCAWLNMWSVGPSLSLTSLNRVGEMLSGWVQVDDMNRPLHTLAVLHHSTAVGGLQSKGGY